MSLKTYEREYDFAGGESPVKRPWPFALHNGQGDPDQDVLAPGMWVVHRVRGGFGVVVAVNDELITILWSQEPRNEGFGVAFPSIRRAPSQTLLANKLVSIQPMSMPTGMIFYMDYKYPKCSNGPSLSKMWACLKERIQSLLSSSVSSWRSPRSGPSMTTASALSQPLPATFGQSLTSKIIEKYSKQQASVLVTGLESSSK